MTNSAVSVLSPEAKIRLFYLILTFIGGMVLIKLLEG